MAQRSPRAGETFPVDAVAQRAALEELHRDRLDQLTELSEAAVTDDELTAPRLVKLRDTVTEVEAALARLDEGSYGICGRCETPIPAERLEIMPHARHCVACQQPKVG